MDWNTVNNPWAKGGRMASRTPWGRNAIEQGWAKAGPYFTPKSDAQIRKEALIQLAVLAAAVAAPALVGAAGGAAAGSGSAAAGAAVPATTMVESATVIAAQVAPAAAGAAGAAGGAGMAALLPFAVGGALSGLQGAAQQGSDALNRLLHRLAPAQRPRLSPGGAEGQAAGDDSFQHPGMQLVERLAGQIGKSKVLELALRRAAASGAVQGLAMQPRLMQVVREAVAGVREVNVWEGGGMSQFEPEKAVKVEDFQYVTDKSGLLLEKRSSKTPSCILYQKQDGSEVVLKFHDQALDTQILSKKQPLEQILIVVSDGNINAMLKHGQWDKRAGGTPTIPVGLASKGGTMDYAVYYLHASFGNVRGDMPRNKNYEAWDNLSGFVWFVDHEEKAYNVHDAGNFLWGYTMYILGYKLDDALDYANKNENGNDASADQRAIQEGHSYRVSTKLVYPGDIRINADDREYYDADMGEYIPQPMLLRRAMTLDGMDYDQ